MSEIFSEYNIVHFAYSSGVLAMALLFFLFVMYVCMWLLYYMNDFTITITRKSKLVTSYDPILDWNPIRGYPKVERKVDDKSTLVDG